VPARRSSRAGRTGAPAVGTRCAGALTRSVPLHWSRGRGRSLWDSSFGVIQAVRTHGCCSAVHQVVPHLIFELGRRGVPAACSSCRRPRPGLPVLRPGTAMCPTGDPAADVGHRLVRCQPHQVEAASATILPAWSASSRTAQPVGRVHRSIATWIVLPGPSMSSFQGPPSRPACVRLRAGTLFSSPGRRRVSRTA
jgi:hypothetical protein